MTFKSKSLALALSISVLAGVAAFDAADARGYRGGVSYNTASARQADYLMQTGKYAEAEAKLLAALKRNPNNVEARGALSMAQAEQYKLDGAEKNAKAVLAKDPKNPAAHIALGMVYRNRTASQDMTYRLQRDMLLAQSAAELEKAIALDPNSPEALNQLGVTYRMQDRFGESEQQFVKALDIDPNFSEALVNQGITKLEKGDIGGAKSTYEQAIRLNSKNYMAHYRLGEAYAKGGDYHEALKHYNNALYLNKGNASIMSAQADAYGKQGNVAAAVANYRKAIQSNPTFMPAYIGISNLFDSRGDSEAAMVELRSAVNVNPNYGPARNQLGRLALTADKPDQALQYYRDSLRANPNDAEAAQGLAQALTVITQKTASQSEALGQESDLVNAEQTIEEALQYAPNDMRLHLAHMRISRLAGKPKDSEEDLNRIVSAPARNETEEMIKGEAYLSLGRYSEADTIFRGLISKSSSNPDKLLTIGDTLKANGDLDRAEEAYKATLTASPGNLKAQRGLQRIEVARADASRNLRLAKALNNWRQKGSSVDFYEDTLSKNPRQPEVRLSLSKLYENQKSYQKAAQSYQFYLGLRPDMEPKERAKFEKKIAKLQQKAQEQALSSAKTANP